MKGGVVLALGALRALAARRADFAEAALLLVCDEEWRTRAVRPRRALRRLGRVPLLRGRRAHAGRAPRASSSAARRPGRSRCRARGRAAHSGSAPDRGRNALLALAAAAQAVAACHAPDGPDRLTAVPTVLHAGDAFNVVPGRGELICDLRADADAGDHRRARRDPARRRRRRARAGARCGCGPGCTRRTRPRALLERATAALGRAGHRRARAAAPATRATSPPRSRCTVDGLGPRGGKAHNPGEFVLADSLRSRAEVALAVIDAALAGVSRLARAARATRARAGAAARAARRAPGR